MIGGPDAWRAALGFMPHLPARATSFAVAMLLTALWAGPVWASSPPDVVVSIKPLHALVSGVMRGIGEPVLLLKGTASPHSYTLRPSEARYLQAAQIVFWIGDSLESFLVKPLSTLAKGAINRKLVDAPGVRLRQNRTEKAQKARDTVGDDHGQSPGDHVHSPGSIDMHIWLDPANADAMVLAIATTLAEVDPVNGQRYRKNATRMQRKLQQMENELDASLKPVRDRPYMVFHDAFQYFEERFDLQATGFITLDPTQKPSAKRLYEIRERIVDKKVRCVFSEPQFEPTLVDTLIRGTKARKGMLDPTGVDLPAGEESYFILIKNMAAGFAGCLLPSHQVIPNAPDRGTLSGK